MSPRTESNARMNPEVKSPAWLLRIGCVRFASSRDNLIGHVFLIGLRSTGQKDSHAFVGKLLGDPPRRSRGRTPLHSSVERRLYGPGISKLKEPIMSPILEKDKTPEPATITTEVEIQEGPAENLERDQKIRSRAYERYLERGQEAGHDVDDWLQAEREIDEGQF